MFFFNGLGHKVKRSLGLDDTSTQSYRLPVTKDQSSYNQQFFNSTLADAAPYLPAQQRSSSQAFLPAANDSRQPPASDQNPNTINSDSTVATSSRAGIVNRSTNSETSMRNANGMSSLGASMSSTSAPLNPRTQSTIETAIVLSQQSALVQSAESTAVVQSHNHGQTSDNFITVSSSSIPVVSQEMSEVAKVALKQAEVFIKQEEWEKAIKACDRALSINPMVAEAHKLMGNVLQYMGNPADSISCYVEALVLNPHYPEVYANLGTVYSTLEDWEQAFSYYCKAVELKPDFQGGYRHLVKAWKRLGQPKEDLSAIRQAMKVVPEIFAPEEHCQMGNHLLNQGKEEDAIACFNTALNQQADCTQAHQSLAKVLEKQGNWEQAVKHYTQVLDASAPSTKTTTPNTNAPSPRKPTPISGNITDTSDSEALAISVDSLVSLARSYVQHDNFEKAINHYKNALSLDPKASEIYRELADVLAQTGQKEQAAESLYRVVMLKSDWVTPSRCVEVGDKLLVQKKSSKALDCYKQALQIDPQCIPARQKIDSVLTAARQAQVNATTDETDVLMAQAGGALPKKPNAVTEADDSATQVMAMQAHKEGETLAKQEKWQEAAEAYRRAIELNPEFSWSHHNLGNVLFELEDWQGAADAQQQAIALNSEFFWSHAVLGDALSKMFQWTEAANAYQKALDIDPHCQQVICKLADVLKTCGQASIDQASALYMQGSEAEDSEEKIYREALALNPEAIDIYLKLARVLVKQDRLDEAIFACQTARQFSPSNIDILSMLSEILRQKEQWNDAATCLHDALLIEPNNHVLHFSLGELWSHSGNLEKAVEAFQKSIAINPSNHWAHQALGNVYSWLGKADTAVMAYQKALEIDPNFAEAYKQMGDALTNLGKGEDASIAYSKALEINPSVL